MYSQSTSKLAHVPASGHAPVREDEEEAEEHDDGAVPDVAEHDAVEEREGRRREEGGVGLFVPGNAVRVHEFLPGVVVVVVFKINVTLQIKPCLSLVFFRVLNHRSRLDKIFSVICCYCFGCVRINVQQ